MANIIRAAAVIITTGIMLSAQTNTVVLQQGLEGYTGCQDKELRNPDKNYFRGPEDRVLVLSETCPSCPYARAAIQFDLSSIPEHEGIVGATLEMFVGAFNGGGKIGDYAIYRITRNWVDNEADWDNASGDTPWTNPGGDYVSEEIDEITVEQKDGYGWVSFNVLEVVKDFVANPDQNFGFLLINTFLSQEVDMPSSEYEKPEWRPKMNIDYTASAVGLNEKRVRPSGMQSPVKMSAVNRKLHVANNSATPVFITLTRLDGTTVASEKLPGRVSKTLSVRSAGVYLISVSGNNFTVNKKISLFH